MAVLSLTLLLTTNLMAQKPQPFVYAGLGVSDYVHQGSGEASWKLGGGADWQFHQRWGLFAELTYGFSGLFKSDFHSVQTLRPMYGTLGISYRIK